MVKIQEALSKYGRGIEKISISQLQKEFGSVFDLERDFTTLCLTRISDDINMYGMLENGIYAFDEMSCHFRKILVAYHVKFGIDQFVGYDDNPIPFPESFQNAVDAYST